MSHKITFLMGLLAMKNNCPANGNVSASFEIHNGSIDSVKLSKTEELFTENVSSKEEVFSDDVGNRILTDLENLKMQFGTVIVSIDVEYGLLKSYTLIPCKTLNANLLKSQIKFHKGNIVEKALRSA